MKKKLLLAGAALLLAAAVTGYSAYEESNISDLLNANVEALARDEEAKCTGPKIMTPFVHAGIRLVALTIMDANGN